MTHQLRASCFTLTHVQRYWQNTYLIKMSGYSPKFMIPLPDCRINAGNCSTRDYVSHFPPTHLFLTFQFNVVIFMSWSQWNAKGNYVCPLQAWHIEPSPSRNTHSHSFPHLTGRNEDDAQDSLASPVLRMVDLPSPGVWEWLHKRNPLLNFLHTSTASRIWNNFLLCLSHCVY